MERSRITIERDKEVALLAHDCKKGDLVEWAKYNRDLLAHHTIYATGTTGALLVQEPGFPSHRLESGPLGRDQQIGARIIDDDEEYGRRTTTGKTACWILLPTRLSPEKAIP